MDDQQNQPNAQNEQQSPSIQDDSNQDPPQPIRAETPQWQYQSGNLSQAGGFGDEATDNPAETTDKNSNDTVHWNASEFIDHEKTGGWYFMVAGGALLLAGIIYFLTRDKLSVIVIILLAIAVAIFGAIKPRVLDYSIGSGGIAVGKKLFSYDQFRSFAVIDDGALPCIMLLPHKRFMVPISMYFAPADGDHIVAVLGDYLPFEHRERDFVDKISAKFRF